MIILGYYKYVKQLWEQKATSTDLYSQRLIEWRQQPATLRIERPTRIDRARELGYKPKQGIFIVRQRVLRGGRQRATIRKGRRSKHFHRRFVGAKSYQIVAERRSVKNYPNCEVLNSYYVGQDGKHYYFEVIVVERTNTAILADKNLKWIANKYGRVDRGLTASGKRTRGILTNKGIGAEKLRPSLRAHNRTAK